MSTIIESKKLSYEGARRVLDAAVAEARKLGVAQVVAILDDGGNLLAFARMDGSPRPSVDVAQTKARTALLGVPTDRLFEMVAGDAALSACMPALAGITLIGGGAPLIAGGCLVGAIGVGGGSPEQDVACASAGCAVLG